MLFFRFFFVFLAFEISYLLFIFFLEFLRVFFFNSYYWRRTNKYKANRRVLREVVVLFNFF